MYLIYFSREVWSPVAACAGKWAQLFLLAFLECDRFWSYLGMRNSGIVDAAGTIDVTLAGAGLIRSGVGAQYT